MPSSHRRIRLVELSILCHLGAAGHLKGESSHAGRTRTFRKLSSPAESTWSRSLGKLISRFANMSGPSEILPGETTCAKCEALLAYFFSFAFSAQWPLLRIRQWILPCRRLHMTRRSFLNIFW